jgi:hypothetical protein
MKASVRYLVVADDCRLRMFSCGMQKLYAEGTELAAGSTALVQKLGIELSHPRVRPPILLFAIEVNSHRES